MIALLSNGNKHLLICSDKFSNLLPIPAVKIHKAGFRCSCSIFPLPLLASSDILITSSTSGVDTSCRIRSVIAMTLCFFGGSTLKNSPAPIIVFCTTPSSSSNQISAVPSIIKFVSNFLS